MAYGRTYRRPVQSTGPRPNKFAGDCSLCGKNVPAGTGILTGNRASGYEVHHGSPRWVGSPVSGRWVGGCEDPMAAAAAVTATGARMSARRGRCEDAPCCGCCD